MKIEFQQLFSRNMVQLAAIIMAYRLQNKDIIINNNNTVEVKTIKALAILKYILTCRACDQALMSTI